MSHDRLCTQGRYQCKQEVGEACVERALTKNTRDFFAQAKNEEELLLKETYVQLKLGLGAAK